MKYLHAMIRTNCPQESIDFYCQGLGLKVIREKKVEAARFTLYFIGENADAPLIELTHNWDQQSYSRGDQFGHLAFEVADIYQLCHHLQSIGVLIVRPPKDGRMAFVKDPNGVSIELLQAGEALKPAEPWIDMPSIGRW